MNEIHERPVREHLVSYLRDRLSENGMMITEESLEFTAERYAAMIISNPELDAGKLIEEVCAVEQKCRFRCVHG